MRIGQWQRALKSKRTIPTLSTGDMNMIGNDWTESLARRRGGRKTPTRLTPTTARLGHEIRKYLEVESLITKDGLFDEQIDIWLISFIQWI
jgi:hypothetical protein